MLNYNFDISWSWLMYIFKNSCLHKMPEVMKPIWEGGIASGDPMSYVPKYLATYMLGGWSLK